MNQSQRQKEPMSKKAKLYWAIGIIIAILVAALLIWHTFFFGKQNANATAATVGDQTYTTTEVSYYYYSVANGFTQQAQAYQQMGMDMGYDPSLSPSEQTYNEEEGTTYADYFLEQALDQLQQVSILCREAEAAGYTLSAEGEQSIQDNMDALYTYSVQSNAGSEESYLRMIYGRNMTKSLFKELLTKSILADEYAAVKSESFTYTDGELDDYYDAHAADLDSYDYRFCYINAEFEDKTDEDGNTVEPTEEETKAAMDAAAEKADKMIAEVRGGTAFNTAAQDYLDETSAESYSDPEYNHKTGDLGSTVTSTYREWLTDDSRQPGDLTSIEVENTGYCVVQFLGREKDTDSYQTMNYRSIQILAETTPSEDGSTALPTEDQLAAAKEQAQGLLDQWKAGDATADSFAALAKENSADETTKENGGLHEDANRTAWMPPSPTGSLPRGVRLGTPLWWRARTAVGTSPATRCFTWRALARSSGSTRPPAPCARKTTTSGTKTCRPNIPQSSPKRERPSPHCNHLPCGGITLPRGFFRRHPHGS